MIFAILLVLGGVDGGRIWAAEDTLKFGMSAAFSGPSKGLGIELYRGAAAYFDYINANGGVYGQKLELLPLDDGYNPTPAIANTIRFIEQDKVFALFSYVGTPTVTRILPLLIKYRQQHAFLLFPFTGAEPHRREPYSQYVFNLRTSYMQETEAIVDRLVSLGRKRIAVFYQADAYGRGGWDGVRRALAKYDLKPVVDVSYPRGSGADYSYAEQARIIHEAGVDAVVAISTYASSAGFVRDLRTLHDNALIASVSFADGDNLIRRLHEMFPGAGGRLAENIINMQVVPCYEDTTLSAVREYRSVMDAYAQLPPEELNPEQYIPRQYSAVSFEGYLNARLVVEMLRRMGPQPKRADIPAVMEGMDSLNLGLDVPVSFSPDRHQGLDRVYFMMLTGDMHMPVRNWERWRL
ncbi:ABC transporter substrate-binding protein [Desulfovibrio mangrovi]|uniref:ABC transporter substrate-binding protein n=1 Tax=Desulfovibrio mangrovi TaxID=2976983 RepID=UPI00224536A4|nr:ABC transporter substrate-binding protein [Desulfovibrio mangrovi]UZP68565.1 ABC transporter substrate-binding protein [Desulfovibrio mangrovi]